MKERVLYDNSKYLLFYSSEGGSIGDGGVPDVPSSEQIGNDFIDDFFMKNVALDENLMQDDGIHPNESAQPILLENVWETIKKNI